MQDNVYNLNFMTNRIDCLKSFELMSSNRYWKYYSTLMDHLFTSLGLKMFITSVNRRGSDTHSKGRSIDIAGFIDSSLNYQDIEQNPEVEKTVLDLIMNLHSEGKIQISQILSPNYIYDLRVNECIQNNKVVSWTEVEGRLRKLEKTHQDHIHITLRRQ